VGVVVEVVRPDQQGHLVARFGQEKQAADDRSLGLDTSRRLAVQKFADAVS
jgi:hypothetical protein